MDYKRGDRVYVEDLWGKKVPQIVWKDAGNIVEVTSEEVFKSLEKNETKLHPLGFPKAEIIKGG